jgi:hypothetical protein
MTAFCTIDLNFMNNSIEAELIDLTYWIIFEFIGLYLVFLWGYQMTRGPNLINSL